MNTFQQLSTRWPSLVLHNIEIVCHQPTSPTWNSEHNVIAIYIVSGWYCQTAEVEAVISCQIACDTTILYLLLKYNG